MSNRVDYDEMFGTKRENVKQPEKSVSSDQAFIEENRRKLEEFRSRSNEREGFFERSEFTPPKTSGFGVGRYRYTEFDRARDEFIHDMWQAWWPTALVVLSAVGVCRLLEMPIEGYPYGIIIGLGVGVMVKYNLLDRMPFSQAAKRNIPMVIILFIIAMLYTAGLATGFFEMLI